MNCPRCGSSNFVTVHGHTQCQCGLYVEECCQGDCTPEITNGSDGIQKTTKDQAQTEET